MPQPYPDPNITSFTGFFEHVNTITGNVALPLFCFVTVIVAFIIMRSSDRYDNASCFLVAMAIGFVFAVMLWAAQLLQGKILVIFLVLTIAAAILNELNRN